MASTTLVECRVYAQEGWKYKSHFHHTTMLSLASGAEVKVAMAKVESAILISTIDRLHTIPLSIVNSSPQARRGSS